MADPRGRVHPAGIVFAYLWLARYRRVVLGQNLAVAISPSGMILRPMAETNYTWAPIISGGPNRVLVTASIAAALLLIVLATLIYGIFPWERGLKPKDRTLSDPDRNSG